MPDKNADNAAFNLVGQKLNGGWTVERLHERSEDATGGHFSVGYFVRNSNGTEGYLKALDYSKAFGSANLAEVLQRVTQDFNFERNILSFCKSRRLDRIITAIDDGQITLAGQYRIPQVSYIIFELASGDIRNRLDIEKRFELALRLRTLHHATTGLRQLHGEKIAHQDLKPSNVLVFEGQGAKLADLGRSSQEGNPSVLDQEPFAGDYTYAPPEILYGHIIHDWKQRRFGADLYLLGSLTFFFFTQTSMTAAIQSNLDPSLHFMNWAKGFHGALPHIRDAFDRAVGEFSGKVKAVAPAIADELTAIVRELCEPDPTLRGDSRNGANNLPRYSLERFISRFDLIARKAELGLHQ